MPRQIFVKFFVKRDLHVAEGVACYSLLMTDALETKRLILRPLMLEDAAQTQKLFPRVQTIAERDLGDYCGRLAGASP